QPGRGGHLRRAQGPRRRRGRRGHAHGRSGAPDVLLTRPGRRQPPDRRGPGRLSGSARAAMRFPGESAEYRAARDRLLDQEIELRRAMEAVAVARRALPPGGVVPEDYVFRGALADGTEAGVRLSELFAPG